MSDLLFETPEFVFSYRVAGICVHDGRVLLQKSANETGFAFPGGHVAYGETHEQTLVREFQEEIGAQVSVGPLQWVGEIFFPWGAKPCQQICLYYRVSLTDGDTPRQGVFLAQEHLQGRDFEMEFHWVSIESLHRMEVYPKNTPVLLENLRGGVQHFIDREQMESPA